MAFDYIRRVWQARQGTNLNKFSKSSETSSSVILANTPDLVTIEGTPFTASAMNNIENGIEDTRAVAYLTELYKDSVSQPLDIVTDGTYLYYLANGASARLYKMSIETKAITELTTVANARALTLYNGVLYIFYYDDTSLGYTWYNISTNEFDFVAVSPGAPTYVNGVVCDGTYFYVVSDVIVRISMTTHAGALWDTISGATNLTSIAYDGTYLYVMDNLKRITRIKVSDKSHTTWTPALPSGAYAFKCTVVDGVYGYVISWGSNTTKTVYKISLSDGTIVDRWSIGDTGAYGLCKNDVEFYFTDLYGNTINRIYQSTEYISPSNILSQVITSANVTVTEDRFGNILLSGALTGNRELALPSTIRTYKIINTCTGAYYVYIRTASGGGVYSAPGDIWDVYCDGTNIKPIRLVGSTREIAGALGTAQTISSGITTTIAWGVNGDVLGEISSGVFTAKNDCTIDFMAEVDVSATTTLTEAQIHIIRNSIQLMREFGRISGAVSLMTASGAVRLTAGQTFSVKVYLTGTGTLTAITGSKLTIRTR